MQGSTLWNNSVLLQTAKSSTPSMWLSGNSSGPSHPSPSGKLAHRGNAVDEAIVCPCPMQSVAGLMPLLPLSGQKYCICAFGKISRGNSSSRRSSSTKAPSTILRSQTLYGGNGAGTRRRCTYELSAFVDLSEETRIFLTVSLGELFQGKMYRLAAATILV